MKGLKNNVVHSPTLHQLIFFIQYIVIFIFFQFRIFIIFFHLFLLVGG